MMIDVSIKDGRTTYRLAKRGQFVALIKRSQTKLEEYDSISCWAKHHSDDDWAPARLQYLNDSSVGRVEEVSAEEAEMFLAVQTAMSEPLPPARRPRSFEELQVLGGGMVSVKT